MPRGQLTKAQIEQRFSDNLNGRKERIARLRQELNAQLDLISYSREQLEEEVKTSLDHKGYTTSVDFIKKLRELSACFGSVTDARIRLLKAEKAHEDDMSPDDEKRAVRSFVRSLECSERRDMIASLILAFHKDFGPASDWVEHANRKSIRDVVTEPTSV